MSTDPFDPEADWPPSADDSAEFSHEESREVTEAIRILEEALPDVEDPVGIYVALYDMYTDLEEMNEAGRCLVEAARRVSATDHSDLSFFLYNHLELFSQLLPEAQSAYERISMLITAGDGDLGANTLHLDQRKIYQHDLIPELLLAQHLHRARVISGPEYLIILHDLCWYSAYAPLSPRTVLYVLDDRELPHRDAAIEFLAHDSGVPYIDMALVEPNPAALEILPPDFIRIRAACAFGLISGEPMVAVLNPFNLQLRDDVANQMENDAHYFLTSATAYTRLLNLVL